MALRNELPEVAPTASDQPPARRTLCVGVPEPLGAGRAPYPVPVGGALAPSQARSGLYSQGQAAVGIRSERLRNKAGMSFVINRMNLEARPPVNEFKAGVAGLTPSICARSGEGTEIASRPPGRWIPKRG